MSKPAPSQHIGTSARDLAPLTWVLPDLRKSLALAVHAVRQYFLATKGTDTTMAQASPVGSLQNARRLFLQGQSALDMIGQGVAAKLLSACANTVQTFFESPVTCTDDAVHALEKAQLAVLDYLDAQLKGGPVQPLGLFPQYRALMEAWRDQPVHPVDLWLQVGDWQTVALSHDTPIVELSPRLKVHLGQCLLTWLNTGDTAAVAQLKLACTSLALQAGTPPSRSLWCIAGAFFEACQCQAIFVDAYVHRTAAHLLAQMHTALQDGSALSESFAQEALFFCLRAPDHHHQQTALLAAVQSAYAGWERPVGDYRLSPYGQFDPVQIDFLRRRLATLSESWSALAGGDRSRSQSVLEHLKAVGVTLQSLSPETVHLVHSLRQIVDEAVQPGAHLNPLLVMEVATTLLYLEAMYDDIDPAVDAMRERLQTLVLRLERLSQGATPLPVEPWMEALFRRLSERQSMGSVTSELRTVLSAVEAALDRYLNDPLDTHQLVLVSSNLSQVHGVFSVLGLQHAAHAIVKIREILDSHLSVETPRRPMPPQRFEQIARSVSTMGFLTDMLSYQITLAKEVFVYDDPSGELKYLHGRDAKANKLSLPVVAGRATSAHVPRRDPAPAKPVPDVPSAAQPVVPAASVPARAMASGPVLEDDQDAKAILGIFFEEATEVLHSASQALAAIDAQACSLDQLLPICSAFHTLKGGARMAGLEGFADAARAFEKLLIQWLAESKQPTQDLMALLGQALQGLSQWIGAIEQSPRQVWSKVPFCASAEAMRLQDRLLPIAQPEAPWQPDAPAAKDEHLATSTPGQDEALPPQALEGFPAALFDLFIAETSDWADRLRAHFSDPPDGGSARDLRAAGDLAHSIRGNAAAVGVQPIADLAQAVEQVLEHLQANGSGLDVHLSLFQEAAAALHDMVLSCAARRPVQAQSALLSELYALQSPTIVEPHLDNPGDAADSDESTDPHPLLAAELPASEALPTVALTPALWIPSVPWRQQAMPAIVPLEEKEDLLDSQDQLDVELLAVFQEEGSELLAALAQALRQWVAAPGDGIHRAQVLRVLHTLKGSGRLAGALRLGELAHRMESAIENLPAQGLTGVQLEPFLERFDRLQGIFEQLGQAADPELHAPSAASPSVAHVAQDAWAAPQERDHSQGLRPLPAMRSGLIRVRTSVIERLVDQAGEVAVYRARTEAHLSQVGTALDDLTQTLDRLAAQLRELELQADMRIQSRNTTGLDLVQQFDPLEFDRFTRLQEITRMMAEAVGDVSTVRRNVKTALSATQQDLDHQARQLRELQRDLLRMRLVDFDAISDRLYSVVRQAAKELGKQVTLDLEGGKIELDRSVLERMTPSFEHLLRNAVVHGIETVQERMAAGKPATGAIHVGVRHDGNDVVIEVRDDGRGVSLDQIRTKARSLGLLATDQEPDREAIIKFMFAPGFSTASQVSELAGRGIGLDVVLSEVHAVGGRIETHSQAGQGTRFTLVLPLTTAVTQVLIFRAGAARFGIPSGLVDAVIRTSPQTLERAYASGRLATEQGQELVFYGAGPLLQLHQDPIDTKTKSLPALVVRSAGQSLALHVDEVLGNREVVVKNMGPQLSRLPGLSGITVLPSGETILVYNPIALANVYGDAVRAAQTAVEQPDSAPSARHQTQAPLVLVVDDALTVRRVLQRLLQREGYRVALANDGVHALQLLEQQRPLMVLSDIEMPRMDGFELARSIRARPEYADLPIVMISSRIAQKHRDHAMALGVNHYLGKPYSDLELLRLIRDQVEAASAGVV